MRSKNYLFARMAIYFWVAMGGALLGVNKAIAQTHCTSNGTGNWSASFACNASAQGSKYTIAAGHTVTVANNVAAGIDTLEVYGTLVFTSGRKVDMSSSGVITVHSGGSVSGGNSGSGFRFGGVHSLNGSFNVSGVAFANSASAAFTNGNPLPVSWLSTNAHSAKGELIVEWATASELNNHHFTIEVSDGQSEFVEVQTTYSQAPGGVSNRVLYYNERVEIPALFSTAEVLYVRIKQQDFDGTTDYSTVLTVNIEKEEKVRVVAAGNNITVSLPYASNAVIRIFTPSGSLVREDKLNSDSAQIPVEPGVYVAMVQSENFGITQQKLIVYP